MNLEEKSIFIQILTPWISFFKENVMAKFFDLYNSVDDFYKSFYRGNEVEFLYQERHYALFPLYNSNEQIVGVIFGNGNEQEDQICTSKDELLLASVGNSRFAEILDQIAIVFHNC